MFQDVQGGRDCDLTDEQKHSVDEMLERLSRYLKTPDGAEMLSRLEGITLGIKERRHAAVPPMLTKREEVAFRFIKRELRSGRSPTVREVAKAVGLNSSRSGSILVQSLIRKAKLKCGMQHRLTLV